MPSPRRPGLTRREHVELGTALQDVRAVLQDAAVALAEAYPARTRAGSAALATIQKLNALRGILDGLSADELPGSLWSPLLYFGHNTDARAQWLADNPLDDERP